MGIVTAAEIVAQNVTAEMMVVKKIVAAMTEETDGKNAERKEEKNAVSLFMEEMMVLTGETVTVRNVTDAVKPVAVNLSNLGAIEKGTA